MNCSRSWIRADCGHDWHVYVLVKVNVNVPGRSVGHPEAAEFLELWGRAKTQGIYRGTTFLFVNVHIYEHVHVLRYWS
jgi:hypothetical protein